MSTNQWKEVKNLEDIYEGNLQKEKYKRNYVNTFNDI